MSYHAPDGTDYKLADAHAHIYKPKIADKASHVIGEFYGVQMAVDDAVSETLCQQGEKVGCDRYLVCSAATVARQVEGINEFVAAECATHPTFMGMGTAHIDCEDFDAVIEQVESLGLHGLKLHPDFQHFNIDDPRIIPLYRACAKRGMVVMFHVGDERPQNDFSSPLRLARVFEQVPDLKVHAAHFGACRIITRRPRALGPAQLAGADIMYDTSSTLAWFTPEQVRDIADDIGTDRLMWGTDYPMWNHDDEVERWLALGYSPEVNRAVFYDNFMRFYSLA